MLVRILGLCILMCFMGAGCSGGRGKALVAQAEQQTDFRSQLFRTSTFTVFGMMRPATKAGSTTLHVYIEGDGYAWQGRTRPSTDPTPNNAIGLSLAMGDNGSNAVLYLARPCQYVQGDDALLCTPAYWTSARLSPAVIKSMNEALNQAKERANATELVLVGYSGGGAAAVLLTAQRNDVRFLGTVAAPLDLSSWTRLHSVSPLHASINPADVVSKVTSVPQRHMSSHADKIVPPSISQFFCRSVDAVQPCVVVEGMEHGDAWEKVWNYTY